MPYTIRPYKTTHAFGHGLQAIKSALDLAVSKSRFTATFTIHARGSRAATSS